MDKNKLTNLERTSAALEKLKASIEVVGVGKEPPAQEVQAQEEVTPSQEISKNDSLVAQVTVVAQEPEPTAQEENNNVDVVALKASEIRALFKGQDFNNEAIAKLYDSLVDKENVTAQEVQATLWNYHQENKPQEVVTSEITTSKRGYHNLNTPPHNGALTMEKTKGAALFHEPHFSKIYNELRDTNRANLLASTYAPQGLKEFIQNPTQQAERKFFELCVETGKTYGQLDNGLGFSQRDRDVNYALVALGRGDFQEYWKGLRTTVYQLELEEPEIQIADLVEKIGLPQAGVNYLHFYFDDGAGYKATPDGQAAYKYKLQARSIQLDTDNYTLGYAINTNAKSQAITGFNAIPAYLKQCKIQFDNTVVNKLGAALAQAYIGKQALTNKTALKAFGFETFQVLDLARAEINRKRKQQKRLNCIVIPEALRFQALTLFNSTALPDAPNSGTYNPTFGYDKETRVIYSNFIIDHLPESDKFTVFAFNLDNVKVFYNEEVGYEPSIYQYEDQATRTYHLDAHMQLDCACLSPEDVIAVTHTLKLPALNEVTNTLDATGFTDYHTKANELSGPATPTI